LTDSDEPRSPCYADLFQPPAIPAQPLTLNSLSRLFEYALSITAWKEFGGNQWALRSNPSSGNLHPTEGYLLIRQTPDVPLPPGLYHYAPKEHALEHRLTRSNDLLSTLLQQFPEHTFLVGLSSVHWREAWKYGERAFRYCQHDLGHAIGTLRMAAATLGWKMMILSGMNDQSVGQLMGLHRLGDFERSEPELPELIAAIMPHHNPGHVSIPLNLGEEALDQCVTGTWQGRANRLSRDNPIPWEIIDDVTKASRKDTHESHAVSFPLLPEASSGTTQHNTDGFTAGHLIHQRRSAVAFDGHTSISAAQFFLMLERVFPFSDVPVTQRPMPWDTLPWDPTIHLALFVHRVEGLLPGMYLLLRRSGEDLRSTFQKAMHEQFLWNTPEGCPNNLPLYLLEDGDAQNIAMQLCCGQEIGGQSAFALSMIAEFDLPLETYGPWFYKRLFWETGLIGQVLYLEAEAAGVRATGIGCFFDDPVHQVLGFHPSTQFQSLYHFTVGGPVEDHRLTTLPPYGQPVT
ncbi:MAG: SagB/ThcOx family dehydrogenase, partial [Nitrospirota bacterium]|nr:SagB/ThcOx family dehydrogenase [Nitrospirota bacterium]